MVSPSGSRRRRWALGVVLAVELMVAVALVVADVVDGTPSGVHAAADHELVRQLHLTGVALWSDASYCRQPALAEPVAAHDVHPGAMDLLPAGSLVPARRWGGGERAP